MVAPPGWQRVDFISDLHLQASEPLTFEAWQRYMAQTRADAVFILGDLFEVWVGDDAVNGSFERQCAAVLHHTAARIPVFFMHGNRDFLVGPAFMAQCHCTLLDDPTVLDFGGQRWLLSHGDALCLADVDYLKFRAVVRSAVWQQDFLAKPLAERKAIARNLRAQSEARKQSAATYADVDTEAACAWLRQAGAGTLIHGHTHQPGSHVMNKGLGRLVLSDWDVAAPTPRAEVLRLSVIASTVSPTGSGVGICRIAPEDA
jgi:UDP-2,3-diacylglucosamine hydrolase